MLTAASFNKVARFVPRVAACASTHASHGAVDHKHGHDVDHHGDHHHHGLSPVERAKITKTHMDFMPVPQGSWQEYHSKRNSRWNIQLLASSAFLIFTFVVMKQNGMFEFHDMPNYKKIKVDAYKSAEEQP